MTTLREAAQQALECLKGVARGKYDGNAAGVCAALETALAQPQPDPVDEYRKGFIAGQIDMRDREQAEPVQKMTAQRAVFFMERFKHEEKLLGPNEQAALDFVIAMLEQQAEPVQQPVAWAEQIIEHLTALHNTEMLRELDSGDALIRLDDAIAAVDEARDRYTPPAPVVPQPLTIERLRDALVASRIIDPGAVEDPDDYDDGLTMHRIEALYRRIA